MSDTAKYLDTIFGTAIAGEIREIVTTSFVQSYEQNASCFDETIGHTRVVYGFMVRSTGIMHLAHAFADRPNVRVTESGNLFNVAFPGGWTMHFYKYRDMQTAKFDRSGVRRSLVMENQLSLFHDTVGTRRPHDVLGLKRHIVVVHQGDPFDGLRSIDIGAPVSMAVDGSQWLWRENIYTATIIRPSSDTDVKPMTSYSDMPIPELPLDFADALNEDEAQGDGS